MVSVLKRLPCIRKGSCKNAC